jgi:hypothetical protein
MQEEVATTPVVPTVRHGLPADAKFNMERFEVVAFPEIVAPPTTERVDNGDDVPIPRRTLVLSQNKSGVLETVEVASQ